MHIRIHNIYALYTYILTHRAWSPLRMQSALHHCVCCDRCVAVSLATARCPSTAVNGNVVSGTNKPPLSALTSRLTAFISPVTSTSVYLPLTACSPHDYFGPVAGEHFPNFSALNTQKCRIPILGHIHIKFWLGRGEVLETVSEGEGGGHTNSIPL